MLGWAKETRVAGPKVVGAMTRAGLEAGTAVLLLAPLEQAAGSMLAKIITSRTGNESANFMEWLVVCVSRPISKLSRHRTVTAGGKLRSPDRQSQIGGQIASASPKFGIVGIEWLRGSLSPFLECA
jgi:hypothetical protein